VLLLAFVAIVLIAAARVSAAQAASARRRRNQRREPLTLGETSADDTPVESHEESAESVKSEAIETPVPTE